jgi:hypothetical protein
MEPKNYKEVWLQVLDLTMGIVKVLLTGAILLLIYLLAGDSLSSMWTDEPLHKDAGQSKVTVAEVYDPASEVENGIHLPTGLVYAEGFEVVRGTCTACHSAKLVTQNRASRSGWQEMIRWMQATQGLWDLGDNEKVILDYLAEHYAPEETGRRATLELDKIEWYILELE